MKPVEIHLACARLIVEATENNPGIDPQNVEKVKQALLDSSYESKDLIAIALLCGMFGNAILHRPEMARTVQEAAIILEKIHRPTLSPESQALLQQIITGEVHVIIGNFWDQCPAGSMQRSCVLCHTAIGTAGENQQAIAERKLQPVCPRCFMGHLKTHAAGKTESLVFGQAMSVDEGLRVMESLDKPGQPN